MLRTGAAGYRCVIRPNRSLTWKEASLAYAAIAAFVLAIGLACYSLGFAFVLPFSGLEIVGLGAGFYVCLWRSTKQEVVSIDQQHFVLERGRFRPLQRYEFNRHWVRVVVQASPQTRYPSRLTIRSHGREVELGAFLNEDDRRRLARELSCALQHA